MLATVFWGCGFSWAKAAGEGVNAAAGLGSSAAYGQVFVLAMRFLCGGFIWFAVFPASRRGWTWPGLWRATLAGVVLGAGMLVQHVGLAQSSVEVSAFLTSLTVLFVPLIGVLFLRKPVAGALWLSVAISTAGIWLLTGATPHGFGPGEWMGLGCAVLFSVYLYVLNLVAARDSGWRVSAGQFVAMGLLCIAAFACMPHASGVPAHGGWLHLMRAPGVALNLTWLVLFPTLGSFGLMGFHQPKITPTRAALIYMLEPLFAATYAWVTRGNALGGTEWLGAGLILLANVGSELWARRAPHSA